MPSRKSPVPTAATSKKSSDPGGPSPAATSTDSDGPGVGGGGDRPRLRGGRGLGRSSGPSAFPRCRGGPAFRSRVSCPSALRPPPLMASSPVVCLRGRSGRADTAALIAVLGNHRAPPHPTHSVVRIAHRGSPHRVRPGHVGDMGRRRCGLRARHFRHRCRRGQSLAARDRGRGDRRRAGGVSTPKGHGASAIRAAIRRGVGSVGRLGHGGSHRRPPRRRTTISPAEVAWQHWIR